MFRLSFTLWVLQEKDYAEPNIFQCSTWGRSCRTQYHLHSAGESFFRTHHYYTFCRRKVLKNPASKHDPILAWGRSCRTQYDYVLQEKGPTELPIILGFAGEHSAEPSTILFSAGERSCRTWHSAWEHSYRTQLHSAIKFQKFLSPKLCFVLQHQETNTEHEKFNSYLTIKFIRFKL